MRAAVILAALCIVFGVVSASASSAEWAAPSSLSDAWSTDLSVSELEARHTEFMMELGASSTAEFPEDAATFALTLTCTQGGSNPCPFTCQTLKDIVNQTYNIPDLVGNTFSCSLTSTTYDDGVAADSSSSSSGAAGRRLLAVQQGTKADLAFGAGSEGTAKRDAAAGAFRESLLCDPAVSASYDSCLAAAAEKYGVNSLADNTEFGQIGGSVQPGSVEPINGGDVGTNSNNVEASGGPRRTNGGYYFLGALVLLFAVIALVYFIVHKKPVQEVAKAEPLRRDEVALAPVVAAPPASGVVVQEDAPLAAGSQQQMDYRSVFALKHNVLDKNAEQKAAEDDEHNHNDVHFILHQ